MDREQQRQVLANSIADHIAVELDVTMKDISEPVIRQIRNIVIRVEDIQRANPKVLKPNK